ncbi:MAG TPA: hypothetical protein VKA48_13365, partial [Gammaproteobacteria bacterium]|nr:hypothetical protein [Gammaproteobacteria bacterium]
GLLKAIGSGRDVAITPDGPRGPGMEAQSGIIQVAARTGLPIIPMAFGASKKKHFPAGTASYCRYPSPAGYSCAVSP